MTHLFHVIGQNRLSSMFPSHLGCLLTLWVSLSCSSKTVAQGTDPISFLWLLLRTILQARTTKNFFGPTLILSPDLKRRCLGGHIDFPILVFTNNENLSLLQSPNISYDKKCLHFAKERNSHVCECQYGCLDVKTLFKEVLTYYS